MKQKKMLKFCGFTFLSFFAIILFCLTTPQCGKLGCLYSLFIGDFSIGFCSRLLVGQLLTLFKSSFTYEWVEAFVLYSTLAVFLVAAAYIGKTLADADKNSFRSVLLFTIFFIISPLSIFTYYGLTFGFLDVYLCLIFLLTIFSGNSKVLIFSTPLLLFAGVMTHESFIFSYMAPCLGVIIYYAIKKHKKSKLSAAAFILSSLSAVATSVYSVLFSRETVKMTEQQMFEYLSVKGNCNIDDIAGYLESFIYFKDTIGDYGADYGDSIFDVGRYMISLAIGFYPNEQIVQTIAVLPALVLIFIVWIRAMKNAEGVIGKAPYLLFMLTVIPQLVAATIISMDYSRFFSTIVITQILYLFVCINQKDEAVMPTIEGFGKKPLCFAIPLIFLIFINIK